MNHRVDFAFRRKGTVTSPLLLECDLQGRVMWMSDRTRVVLGNPQDLAEVMLRGEVLAKAGEVEMARFVFWGVWLTRTRAVLGVQGVREETGESRALALLEGRFVLHFLRLLELERRLSGQVQRRRGHDGRRAVRQIERERQRLGRELHTGVGQMLAAIRLQLEVISAEWPTPPGKAGAALSAISTLAADTLEQVRGISRRLHPPEWQRLSLEAAIRQLWDVSGVPQRFEASLEIEALPWEPELEVKVLIYRGLQEALSNLARHSRATRIHVTLEARDEFLVLSILDNGVGFDVAKVFAAQANITSGIGLRAMRETTEELGGQLTVESGAEGTKLVISVAPFPVDS